MQMNPRKNSRSRQAQITVVRRLMPFLLLGSFLAGCGSKPAPVEPAPDPASTVGQAEYSAADLAALRAAFAHLTSLEPPGETVFVALDPINPRSGAPIDPPPEFLENLQDLPVVVKPAGQSRRTREPVLDPERPNRYILDPETGAGSTIYWVNIAGRPDDGGYIIEAGGFRGILNSWGFLARVEKLGGRPQVTRQWGEWKL